MVTFILLIVGGINWLLMAFGVNLVESILGVELARIAYILVGLSALYEFIMHRKFCAKCSAAKVTTP